MSILDTFYILFKNNSDEVIKANKEIDKSSQGTAENLKKANEQAENLCTLRGLFEVAWEFPSVSPPEYLRDLNPALYEQERQRIMVFPSPPAAIHAQGDFAGLRRSGAAQPPFRNPDLPVEQRVDDLISRLTTEEKISQTMMASPAIPRLEII